MTWNRNAAIVDGDGPLTFKANVACLQFQTQRLLVNPLEKPWTKRSMDGDCGPYR